MSFQRDEQTTSKWIAELKALECATGADICTLRKSAGIWPTILSHTPLLKAQLEILVDEPQTFGRASNALVGSDGTGQPLEFHTRRGTLITVHRFPPLVINRKEAEWDLSIGLSRLYITMDSVKNTLSCSAEPSVTIPEMNSLQSFHALVHLSEAEQSKRVLIDPNPTFDFKQAVEAFAMAEAVNDVNDFFMALPSEGGLRHCVEEVYRACND